LLDQVFVLDELCHDSIGLFAVHNCPLDIKMSRSLAPLTHRDHCRCSLMYTPEISEGHTIPTADLHL
jgi:hypothetical protein